MSSSAFILVVGGHPCFPYRSFLQHNKELIRKHYEKSDIFYVRKKTEMLIEAAVKNTINFYKVLLF